MIKFNSIFEEICVVEYTSLVDAITALAKVLNSYEIKYLMSSEDFYYKYTSGETADDEDLIEWAGNYQHFLAIRHEIESKLKNVG